jgi:hypothetical protein
MIHNGVEYVHLPPRLEVVREERFEAKIPGTDKIVSGKIDLYIPAPICRLEDYKSCAKVPDAVKKDHLVQLAIYTYLLRWNGYQVNNAAINYIHDYKVIQMDEFLLDGERVPIMEHPLMSSEAHFIKKLSRAYSVLYDGYHNGILPGVNFCNTRWCRGCDVAWACKQLPQETGEFAPEKLIQT